MSKYVPRSVQWEEGEPLGIEGEVIGILSAKRATRRATLLVEVPDDSISEPTEINFEKKDEEDVPDIAQIPEEEEDDDTYEYDGETLEDASYRDLQEIAQAKDIKANQSTEDLIEAIRNE